MKYRRLLLNPKGHLHNIMYIVFRSALMFEYKLNLSLSQERGRRKKCCSLNARHVARCPITLSSTCNLMLRGEEGPASLPPGWFMIEDMLIKISKQSELWWGRYRCVAYIMLDRERPARWYYARMDAPSPCSCIEYAAVVCFWEGRWG